MKFGPHSMLVLKFKLDFGLYLYVDVHVETGAAHLIVLRCKTNFSESLTVAIDTRPPLTLPIPHNEEETAGDLRVVKQQNMKL